MSVLFGVCSWRSLTTLRGLSCLPSMKTSSNRSASPSWRSMSGPSPTLTSSRRPSMRSRRSISRRSCDRRGWRQRVLHLTRALCRPRRTLRCLRHPSLRRACEKWRRKMSDQLEATTGTVATVKVKQFEVWNIQDVLSDLVPYCLLSSDLFMIMSSDEFHMTLLISQHWSRQWLGCCQATSHYLNQCWPSSAVVTKRKYILAAMAKQWTV